MVTDAPAMHAKSRPETSIPGRRSVFSFIEAKTPSLSELAPRQPHPYHTPLAGC